MSIFVIMKSFTVKFITINTEQQFQYDPLNESFEDFQNKVIESIPVEWSEYKGVKFIFAGVVINKNNFYMVSDKSVLMAVFTKTRGMSVLEPTGAQHVTIEQSGLEQSGLEQSGLEQSGLEHHSIDSLYISAITFMAYIRENPALFALFSQNMDELTRVLRNPEFKQIYSQILNNSEKLLENGESIVKNIQLDEQDNKQINIMISMGFNKNIVFDAYVRNNKDINATLNFLMNE